MGPRHRETAFVRCGLVRRSGQFVLLSEPLHRALSPDCSKGYVHRELGSAKIAGAKRFISGPGGVPTQIECSADLFGFAPVEGRKVVAEFDGGMMTTQAGAMLLGATDRRIRLIERFAGCFIDHRAADLVVREVSGLVGQRVFGIALGYEDLIDHDQLRHEPVMAMLGGKLEGGRAASRQIDAQPAGVEPATADPLSQDRL